MNIQAFLPLLNFSDSISKKMNSLARTSCLSIYDLSNRQRILDYIHKLFQSFYPDCTLVAFGSSVNGFGTAGCDMDMMFSPSCDYENLVALDIMADEKVPYFKKAMKDPSVRANLKYMSKENQLRFLLRVLRRNKCQFRNTVYIPAKCPIVRFVTVHMHYRLRCDLSFKHGLAKFNSELLRFFSELDSRVKTLMITLRFWAKNLSIINTAAFSSYAFSLLVIFFLQNIEEPILPSVTDLMANAESCVVDGWEAGFVPDLPQDFVSRNTLSEGQLLEEFFKFYWNFDFAKNVVCIRSGKKLPISDIRKDTDKRMENFMIGDVCVQDPFDLSHNVASSVKLNRLHLLKPYFLVANLILSKQLQSLEAEDAFLLLFNKELFETKIHSHFFLHWEEPFECFYLYPSPEFIALIGEDFEKIWFEKASQAIRDILEYVLFFDCEVIDKKCSFDDADLSDGYFDNEQKHGELILSIQCTVDNRLWKFRVAKKDVLLDSYMQDFSNDVLKKENALSHFQLASTPSLLSPQPLFIFLCNLHKSKYSQIPCIWVDLIPLTFSSEFRSVSKVLKGFISMTLQNMLIN